MNKSRQKLYVALFLFTWAAFYIACAIVVWKQGYFSQGHFGATTGPDVHPDAQPFHFWGVLLLCFALAAFGLWRGVAELRAFLRQREM